ncbi:MAG: hypothetical protein JSW04_00110 [Desulfobacterales bacterium]|nr:MAG: hypothetical protein JSW04_00110 [Desulfobacterales bacterium]
MEIKQPGAHIDHMVRQTRMHHTQLSSMADMKANILLTMASVVVTLSVRYITEPHLKSATIVLIVFCLLTIVLASYSVMPKTHLFRNSRGPSKAKKSKFNLLFFGDFISLEYDEFEAAMEEVINDATRTYQVQLQEIYTLGVYLAKHKYRFLRLAYTAFIMGAIFSSLVGLFSGALG